MRTALPFLMLSLLAQPAHALEVRLRAVSDTVVLDVPAQEAPLAIFRRFDDIWLVSSAAGDPIRLVADEALGRQAGLRRTEALQVTGGAGLRLAFQRLSGVALTAEANTYTLTLNQPDGTSVGALGISPSPDGAIAGTGLGGFARATSMETRESYAVVTTSAPEATRAERVVGGVLALPTLLGGAFVAADGVPLGGEKTASGVRLTPMRDASSVAAARTGKRQVDGAFIASLLQELSPQTAATPPAPQAQAQPAQPRVAATPTFQPRPITGRFENALDGLNQALQAIEQIESTRGTATPTPPTPALTPPPAEEAPAPRAPATPTAVASAPATVTYDGPAALPENTFLPNFGDRGRREYYQLEQRFRKRMMEDPSPDEQLKARSRLAKLMFFNNRFYEALGMLQTMPQDPRLNLPRDRDARLLYGATLVQLGRPADALKVFATDDAPSPDRAVWEAVAQGALGNHAKAAEMFEQQLEYTKQYPKHTQQHLRYAYALSLFHLERYGKMSDQIDYLAGLGGTDDVLAYAQLLMARTYVLRNQDVIAEQIFVNLANHPNQIVANHALLEYINLLLKRGDIGIEQAIMHYENLRFIWRGDEVEKESLFRLGNLYLEDDRPREGLETLKYLTVVFPGTPRAEEAARTMVESFTELYLQGKADRVLPPLDILGVYYDFRELTPPGERGDAVVANIIDRLSRVGLYQRAIEVMEGQLKFRLKEAMPRARAGATLANLHFLHYNADAGLKVLDDTAAPDLPPELTHRRTEVRAHLLSLAGDHQGALNAALTLPAGKENDYLRADMAFRVPDYAAVERFIRPHLLDKRLAWWQHDDTMAFSRLALALSVNGKAAELEELQQRYAENIAELDIVNEVNFLTQNAGSTKMPVGTPGDLRGRHRIWNNLYAQVAKYNQFADRYQDMVRARQAERRLPPPAVAQPPEGVPF